MCADVTVGTDPTLKTGVRVKRIVGDFKSIRRSIARQLEFRE